MDALEKTAHFTLGCKSLTVGTDHKPLIPGDKPGEREDPQADQERLMRWDLRVIYIPGKNLGGTDALSRYGVRGHNYETVN